MFKVNIIKNQTVTHSAQFLTQQECLNWVESCKLVNAFGKNQREVLLIETLDLQGSPITYLDNNEDINLSLSSRQETDLMGNLKTYHLLPAEYEVVISDITLENQAKLDSDNALKYLAETDYLVIRKAETGVDYPQSIKDARAAARLKVVK